MKKNDFLKSFAPGILLLMFSLAVFLQPVRRVFAEDYDLWVGGTRVTSENASDLSDDRNTGKIFYDAGSNTLHLQNARITGSYCVGDGWKAVLYGIYCTGKLNISLSGSNSILGNGVSVSSLSVAGNGKLEMNKPITCGYLFLAPESEVNISTSGSSSTSGKGVYIGEEADIRGRLSVKVTGFTPSAGIGASEYSAIRVNIPGTAELYATGYSSTGIDTFGGDVSVSGNLSVTGASIGILGNDLSVTNTGRLKIEDCSTAASVKKISMGSKLVLAAGEDSDSAVSAPFSTDILKNSSYVEVCPVTPITSARLSKNSFTFTGEKITPDNRITVKAGKTLLEPAKDYTVSYKKNKYVGTAQATVKGTGRYNGKITLSFTIRKAGQPMTAKAKTVTLKAGKLKTAAQTVEISKAVTIRKAKGTLSFRKSAGSGKITVNKTTGKITVKKGTKKGTYSAKIVITAAGDENYKKGSKTVTVKVTVK